MRLLPDTLRRCREDWVAYIAALLFVDAAAAACALALAFHASPGEHLSVPLYFVLAAIVMALWLVLVTVCGLYARERLLSGIDEYARVFQAGISLPIGLVLVDFVLAWSLISRAWLLVFSASLILFAGVARMAARRIANAARRRGAFVSRVIVVGGNEQAVRFARRLRETGFEVLGFFDDYRPTGSRIGAGDWPVFGGAHEMSRARDLGADEVIIVPSALSWESRRTCLASPGRGRLRVRVLAERDDALTAGIRVSQRAGVPVYALDEMRLTGLEAGLKRTLDVAVASVLIACLTPFALPRVIVRLCAGRPVFESHTLLAAHGRTITVHTLCGAGNRAVSKLPAVMAVLRGHLSIVGPVDVDEDGRASAPELSMMKPGLTSVIWADRRTVDEASAAAIQIEYVRNYSIWRDLQVLWHRTLAIGRASHQVLGTPAFWEIRGYAAEQMEQEI